ncbi:argininosuccinate lyase [Nocardia sp. 852002-20019_SCH5090214]|uniref:Argininosuccinate lyase n=1 Tax=Nocardia nova TaxID=37330 RepID=A0A2S6A8W3_9NOCA|nr:MULTISPECIES: ArsA family ATPase [Nocardia]OBF83202.1 argininosuccinate lyase [Mycobacterium sp. 852002-51759_SCH5129042]MBF6274645.1 ArsA family ATPase [Nocardia nova]MBV7705195.1 ArsA family ATPase [Nocardia nova]OBA52520.1 argininosuccinate lyase [Nocardia sp. 852002-51101_SCH5132738]OBA64624.1 argininosuccinate lyase [Nocardia sp. 852002-20019_SCH5090214]
MFIGKGGVGKTTLACAAAIAAVQAGQRVLVASVDQAHSLGDALGFRFAHDPGTVAGVVTVAPGFDVIEIDSLALLEDRFRDVARMLSGAGHDHGIDLAALDPAELTGLPGVQELLALTEIAQFAGEDDWDLIIVDCPPSADMLRIVTAPDTLLGYLERIWPTHARVLSATGTDMRRAVLAATVERIAAAVTAIRDLLADSHRTGARLITGAERVALAESARVRSAAALLGIRLDAVVVNKVLPPVPPADGGAHPAVQWYLQRRAEQLDVIADLRRRMPDVPVVIAHHSGPEPVGPRALSALAQALPVRGNPPTAEPDPMLGDTTPEPGTAAGEPEVRWESGTGLDSVFTLRMRLPVVDPGTLRLGRVEDDVIVGADGVRRRLRLAPVLRRCTVDSAELDGEQLIVRFRPDPGVWPQ